jgi:hypothetical protein
MKIFLLMMLIGVIVGATRLSSRRQPQQIAPAPADSVVANV